MPLCSAGYRGRCAQGLLQIQPLDGLLDDSLPAYLLPEPFTLPQLQRMYETVLGRPVDKSGFRTRTLAADFLEEVGTVEGESNRTALAYRLRDRDHVVTFPRTFSPRGGLP